MKEIPLTQGKVAIVDDEDFEALNVVNWCAHRDNCTFYAVRSVRIRGMKTTESIHRILLARKLGRDLLSSERVDHVNGDGLDDRRENLRLATCSQNQRNRHRRKTNPSSRFLGVSWYRGNLRWCARIRINGKNVFLGGYLTELEAAQAREKFIAERPELMARSNFSQQQGMPP